MSYHSSNTSLTNLKTSVSSLSVVLVIICVVMLEGVAALNVPFARRVTLDISTTPALVTLPMPLHFDSNGRYAVQVTMGSTNPQPFNFSISTGFSLTFVAGQSCSDCSVTPLYNQGESSSAVSLNRKDNTTFYGTTTSGQLIKETCGAKLSNGSTWAYPNQTCIVVDSQTSGLFGSGTSGILGLGINGGSNGTSSSGLSFEDTIYGQWFPRHATNINFTFGMMLYPPTAKPTPGSEAGTLHWTKPDASFFISILHRV